MTKQAEKALMRDILRSQVARSRRITRLILSGQAALNRWRTLASETKEAK